MMGIFSGNHNKIDTTMEGVDCQQGHKDQKGIKVIPV